MSKHIVVFGKGAWGKSIGLLLEHNGITPTFVDIGDSPIREIDVAFLVIPTQVLRSVLQTHKAFFSDKTIIVNCAKGIEQETLKFPFQIVEDVLSLNRYHTLAGPSFAEEVAEKQPTLVNIGFHNEDHTKEITRCIETPVFRVEETAYGTSLELSGALKNVYAVVSGFSDGLGYGRNTRAAIQTIALKEFSALAHALHFQYDTLALPGIIGDFVLTCSSEQSRNYTFGKNAAHMSSDEALQKSKGVAEGYYASASIRTLSEKQSVPMPLATISAQIAEKGKEAGPIFRTFLETL